MLATFPRGKASLARIAAGAGGLSPLVWITRGAVFTLVFTLLLRPGRMIWAEFNQKNLQEMTRCRG